MQVFLPYGGQTTEKTPEARLIDDLTSGEPHHFGHFVRYAAALRAAAGLRPAVWNVYRYKESTHCTALELRQRTDLQASEIAVINSLMSFSLNSAFGGYHHLDTMVELTSPSPSPLLTAVPALDAAKTGRIRAHLVAQRRICDSLPASGPKVTDQAVEHIVRQATDLRPIGDYTLSLTVAKDITAEALRATDERVDSFGEEAGPGPAWCLFARRDVVSGAGIDEQFRSGSRGSAASSTCGLSFWSTSWSGFPSSSYCATCTSLAHLSSAPTQRRSPTFLFLRIRKSPPRNSDEYLERCRRSNARIKQMPSPPTTRSSSGSRTSLLVGAWLVANPQQLNLKWLSALDLPRCIVRVIGMSSDTPTNDMDRIWTGS